MRQALQFSVRADLASANCRSEDVRVGAVIIPELKFRHVQRQIFGADFMETADHATLEDAPKPFNRIGMHRADYILLAVVINRLVIVAGLPRRMLK